MMTYRLWGDILNVVDMVMDMDLDLVAAATCASHSFLLFRFVQLHYIKKKNEWKTKHRQGFPPVMCNHQM